MSGDEPRRRVSDEEIAATSAQIASALAGVAAAVESLQSELAHRQADLAQRSDETHRYKTDLDAIRESTAWRLTALPRRLITLCPRSMRGGLRKVAKGLWWAATPWRTPERLRFLKHAAAVAAVPDSGETQAAAPAAPSPDAAYQYWIETYEPHPSPLNPPKSGARGAGVSFLLTGDDPARASRTVSSLARQTLGDWELVSAVAVEGAGPKARVQIVPQAAGLDRAAALAVLARRATSEWIAVLDAGDTLTSDAVAEITAAIAQTPAAAIVYSDEDEAEADGARLNPYFKPSWSPQLLQAFNYFGRLTVLSRELLAEVGGFLPEDAAAVEWSANLRVAEAATSRGRDIVRLARVACHRSAGGERERPRPATAAAAQNRAMLRRYWARQGHDARIETSFNGAQHATWTIQAPPLVSIIIPSHDKVDLIRRCLTGILDETDYDNFEVIVVENNSKEPATWDFYDEMKSEPRVRIVRRDGRFNYSRVCNHGAAEARGSLLLFLNNDVEVVQRDWLAELVRVAGLPEVGVVGTKLRYPNGGLQHGGVVAGVHLFGLAYHSCDEHRWGVFGSPGHPRNWLAIMGACQMVRRDVFDLVGGFDEAYDIANSDVALCVKAHLAGRRTAYTPFAELIHHEGLTRGHTNPPGDMVRSARLLAQVGMQVDPYLHPGLSGMDGAFRLRGPGEPSLQEMMRINIANVVGQTVLHPQPLDLFDSLAVAKACGLEASQLSWPPQDAALISSTWSAARWVMDLLRRRSELRLRFPGALTEGAAGAFGTWIAGEGAAEHRLNAAAVTAIAAALEDDLGARVFAALVAREDTRSANPLALLPPGRRDFSRWLFREAQDTFSLRLEEIWWFLLCIAEQPGKALERTFLMTPDWQDAFPDALTLFGKDRFSAWFSHKYYLGAGDTWLAAFDPTHALPPDQQLRLAYAANARWRSAHPKAFSSVACAQALLEWLASVAGGLDEDCRRWCAKRLDDGTIEDLAACGVNVAGHFCYPSGLKISVESLTNGVEAAGGKATRRNVRVAPSDEPRQGRFLGLEPYDVTVFHIQPEPFFPERYARAMLAPRKPNPYKIAYWYWELEAVPPYWTELSLSVDEIWAATNFVADALRPITQRPVRTLFPGLELGPFKPQPLRAFGLDDRPRFTFLFSFHMASVMERKNPFGLIAAFKRAFRLDEPVALILKTTSDAGHAGNIDKLKSAIGDASIEIFDKTLDPDQTLSLMNACDAYVSLHRSEGLGLTMAEAMLLGKPVVATRYSGNLDFMSDANSLLVDYRMKPVGLATPPYDPDGLWADPSVEHAALLMRRLYEDQGFARALGDRGRRDATANLSISAAGERVMARLDEIRAERPPADALRRPGAI